MAVRKRKETACLVCRWGCGRPQSVHLTLTRPLFKVELEIKFQRQRRDSQALGPKEHCRSGSPGPRPSSAPPLDPCPGPSKSPLDFFLQLLQNENTIAAS